MVLLFFIAVLCGVAVSYIHVSYASFVTLICVALIIYIYSKFGEESVRKVSRGCAFFICGMCIGCMRVFFISYPDISVLTPHVDTKVMLLGVVDREPTSDGSTTRIYIQTSALIHGSTTIPVETGVLVRAGAFPEFAYGDEVRVTGTLKLPEEIVNEDGRVFDYQMFLFTKDVTHTLSFAQIEKVGEKGNPVFRILFNIKSAFIDSIRRVLPEPSAGLLAGILLGTDTLPKDLKEHFRVAGLSHIVVLSGYNITVVAESVLLFAQYIVPRIAFGLSSVSVVLFVLMAGAGASAVRAGIMAQIALLGRSRGSTYDASRALLLAIVVMVLWNPSTLIYDPSFHLSVLATYGVMYGPPIILKYLLFITERFGLREMCATTLGAQCAVLPYILYMSGDFSLFALPANFLVLAFVPLTMLLGFVTGILGFFSRFVALIPGIPAHLFLSWDVLVGEVVSALPYASLHVPHIPFLFIFMFYVTVGGWLYHYNTKVNPPSVQVHAGDDSVVSY